MEKTKVSSLVGAINKSRLTSHTKLVLHILNHYTEGGADFQTGKWHFSMKELENHAGLTAAQVKECLDEAEKAGFVKNRSEYGLSLSLPNNFLMAFSEL